MIAVLAGAGLGILTLPHLLRRLGRRLAPRLWSALCTGALAGGTVLVIGTGLLASLSTMLLIAGRPAVAHACDAMFGHMVTSGSPLAFIVLGFTASAVVLGIRAVRSARHVTAAAWVEPGVGGRLQRNGAFEFVVLEDLRPHAVCVPGTMRRPHQVLLTSGLVATLTTDELDLVCAHEEEHLRLKHHRQLALALAAEQSMWFWPPAASSVRALRLSLERAADEAATGSEPQARSRLRSALLAVAIAGGPSALAAFSPLDGLMERVAAMGEPRPRTVSPLRWGALFIPGLVIGAVALFAAVRLGHSAYCLLTMPLSCNLR
jgi:Zn-dependent protease with chaperone function